MFFLLFDFCCLYRFKKKKKQKEKKKYSKEKSYIRVHRVANMEMSKLKTRYNWKKMITMCPHGWNDGVSGYEHEITIKDSFDYDDFFFLKNMVMLIKKMIMEKSKWKNKIK